MATMRYDPKKLPTQNLFATPDSGYAESENVTSAFSGLPQNSTVFRNPDGSFMLEQGSDGRRANRADLTVRPNGSVNVGDFKAFDGGSIGSTLANAGLLAGGMFTGLGALGAGPMAGLFGAGAGAGAAAGEAAVPNALGFGLEGSAGYIVPEGTGALGFGTGYVMPTTSGLAQGGSTGGSLLGSAVDKVIKNPKTAAQAAGGLLGGASGAGGDESYSGPMPTITRGGFLPQVQAMSMPMQDASLLTTMPKKGEKHSGLYRFLG